MGVVALADDGSTTLLDAGPEARIDTTASKPRPMLFVDTSTTGDASVPHSFAVMKPVSSPAPLSTAAPAAIGCATAARCRRATIDRAARAGD